MVPEGVSTAPATELEDCIWLYACVKAGHDASLPEGFQSEDCDIDARFLCCGPEDGSAFIGLEPLAWLVKWEE